MMRISSLAPCRALPLELRVEALTLGQGRAWHTLLELLHRVERWAKPTNWKRSLGRDNSLIVGDFHKALHKPKVDPAPLAPTERKLRR